MPMTHEPLPFDLKLAREAFTTAASCTAPPPGALPTA